MLAPEPSLNVFSPVRRGVLDLLEVRDREVGHAESLRPAKPSTPRREPQTNPAADNADVRSAVVVLAAGILLVGCGTETIKQHGAEQSVANVVAKRTGFRPTDVKCPSGVQAKAGTTFDCHFTGPEPKPYVAHVRVVNVRGQRVVFFVRTRPSG
jgi:hypothetical protein